MSQENEKGELRVEDRRHFDSEGNPLPHDEAGKNGTTEERAEAPTQESSTRSGSTGQPKIDFTSLVFIYVQTALVHLGELPEPGKDQPVTNLEAARQMIDIIELLRDKTRGNLSPDEDQYLEKVLFDLRLLYVQKAKLS
jgi:hypothetical protein